MPALSTSRPRPQAARRAPRTTRQSAGSAARARSPQVVNAQILVGLGDDACPSPAADVQMVRRPAGRRQFACAPRGSGRPMNSVACRCPGPPSAWAYGSMACGTASQSTMRSAGSSGWIGWLTPASSSNGSRIAGPRPPRRARWPTGGQRRQAVEREAHWGTFGLPPPVLALGPARPAHDCSATSARRRLALPGLSTKTQRLPWRLQCSLTRQ